MGKKKRPYYRIVAIDSRKARDGKFLESVGTYDPVKKPAEVLFHEDRVSYWLDTGAIPSDTVASLMAQTGFSEKYQRAKRGEDVSELTLKTTLTERKKRTRKAKKAALAEAKAEEAKAEAAAEETEGQAEEAAAEEEAPAEEGGQEEKTE
jgi:small subunit ribosomal protein S16